MPRTAILDANVLYSSFLRDFLIRLARTGVIRVCWTDEIHDEWMDALRRARPDVGEEKLERVRRLMDAAVDDALVTGYAHRISALQLPDAGDRHVLAAAIVAGADTIVSFNVRDFPAGALTPHGIHAKTPDEFAIELYRSHPEAVAAAARQHRGALRKPPFTGGEYLALLHRSGLLQLTTAFVRDRTEL